MGPKGKNSNFCRGCHLLMSVALISIPTETPDNRITLRLCGPSLAIETDPVDADDPCPRNGPPPPSKRYFEGMPFQRAMYHIRIRNFHGNESPFYAFVSFLILHQFCSGWTMGLACKNDVREGMAASPLSLRNCCSILLGFLFGNGTNSARARHGLIKLKIGHI